LAFFVGSPDLGLDANHNIHLPSEEEEEEEEEFFLTSPLIGPLSYLRSNLR
jgi:hypothetical protein